MVSLVSNKYCCTVESDIKTLEDAKKSLVVARENLFGALKCYFRKREGSIAVITFYEERIIYLRKIIECLE